MRIMPHEIQPAILPDFLQPKTIGNMPYDTPHHLRSAYLSLRDGTGELFVDTRDMLPKATRKAKLGEVALMRVAITEGDELKSGYVADIRRAKVSGFYDAPSAERPDDQELLDQWLKDYNAAMPVAAIAYKDKHVEGGIATTGDTRFAAAAVHLAQLADAIENTEKSKAKAKSNKKKSSEKSTEPTVPKGAFAKFKDWLGI